jgi:hypothetical protein
LRIPILGRKQRSKAVGDEQQTSQRGQGDFSLFYFSTLPPAGTPKSLTLGWGIGDLFAPQDAIRLLH